MTRWLSGLTLGLGLGLVLLVGCKPTVGTTSVAATQDLLDRDTLEQKAREEKERAERALIEAREKFEEAALVVSAKEAKVEIDKVLKSDKEIDVVFAKPVEGDEQVKDHQARMKKMDRVKLDNVEVAYEQQDTVTVNSKSYKRHFRVLYVKEGRVYGFSYYTMEEIDGAAFVTLVRKFFPIVDVQMTNYTVEVKKGQP